MNPIMEAPGSEDKEVQTPRGIIQLLKPVRHNPYSADPQIDWFLINVNRNGRTSRRYYLNVSRHPRHLLNELPTFLESAGCRNWHSIFFLTPHRDFIQLRYRFPMTVFRLKRTMGVGYPYRVAIPKRRRKTKKQKPNGRGQANPMQLLCPLARVSPNERVAHLPESPGPSDLPIRQCPNPTESEAESEFSESEYSEGE